MEFVKSDCGLAWISYLKPFGLAKTEPARVVVWVQHVIDALDGVSYVMPGYSYQLGLGHRDIGACFQAWDKAGFGEAIESAYALGGLGAVRAVVLPALSKSMIPPGAKIEGAA